MIQTKERVELDWGLTKDVECQVLKGCDISAAWLCKSTCCTQLTTLCEEHARRSKAHLALIARHGPHSGKHTNCGTSPFPPPEWIEL